MSRKLAHPESLASQHTFNQLSMRVISCTCPVSAADVDITSSSRGRWTSTVKACGRLEAPMYKGYDHPVTDLILIHRIALRMYPNWNSTSLWATRGSPLEIGSLTASDGFLPIKRTRSLLSNSSDLLHPPNAARKLRIGNYSSGPTIAVLHLRGDIATENYGPLSSSTDLNGRGFQNFCWPSASFPCGSEGVKYAGPQRAKDMLPSDCTHGRPGHSDSQPSDTPLAGHSQREDKKGDHAYDLRGTNLHSETFPQTSSQWLASTPCPLAGFPLVHREDPGSLMRGLDPAQLNVWRSFPSNTTALVEIFGQLFPTNDEAADLVDVLRDTIRAATGCATINVAAPLSAQRSTLESRPRCFFLWNLSPTVAEELKGRRCCSWKHISFFVYDITPSLPEYLFTLEGFTTTDAAELTTIVRGVLNHPYHRDYILALSHVDSAPPGSPASTFIDDIIRSVKVIPWRIAERGPVFANVYCKSPTTSPERWRVWRDSVGSARFCSYLYRVGTRRRTGWSAGMESSPVYRQA
ncbi:hypothetical protein OH77DRAFT_334708 [Trametes cingulata]|nr:hypothetical protein OH77DRAFT_334708 [Trametes cingulata]